MPINPNKIKEARGLSSYLQFAFQVGQNLGRALTPKSLIDWERGACPSANKLEAIAKASGKPLEWFFEADEKPTRATKKAVKRPARKSGKSAPKKPSAKRRARPQV